VFRGVVKHIEKVANRKDEDGTVKVYGVDIYLHAKANFRLKPGLSVRAGIVLDTLSHAFRIPKWCLFQEEGKTWVESEEAGKIPVKLLAQLDGFAFVQGALKKGMLLKSKM